MKTNVLFDEAWRELQAARRSENIDEIISAIARLQRGARMMKLDQQQQNEENKLAVNPFDGPIKYQ